MTTVMHQAAPAEELAPTLLVEDLRVSYRVRSDSGFGHRDFDAVKGVSLTIGPGETVGLVGESGSGKTTVGRAILGLVQISGGTVTYGSRNLAKTREATPLDTRRVIQAVLQDPWSSLNPRRQVGRILGDVLLRHDKCPRNEVDRVARRLLDDVGLPTQFVERFPTELSGGQRQRVSIARALAVEPQLIVCDEVVSALDVSTQAQILRLMQVLQESAGISYLFISHDLAVVGDISHRIAVMSQGELVESGPAAEVFSNPTHQYTRDLLHAIPGSRAAAADA